MRTHLVIGLLSLLGLGCPSKPDVSDAGPSPSATSSADASAPPLPPLPTASASAPPVVHEPGTVHSATTPPSPHEPPPPEEPTMERLDKPAKSRKTPGELSSVSILRDGSLLAIFFDKGVMLIELPSGTGYLMRTHTGIADIEQSPEKSLLAVADNSDRLLLWEMPAGKLRRTWKDVHGPIAFTKDAKKIAAVDKAVAVWDTSSGAESFRTDPIESSAGAIVFGNLEKEIVVMVGFTEVMAYDLATKAKTGGGDAQTGATFGISLSPDGRFAAASAPDGHGMQVFDVHAWKPRTLVQVESCQEHIFPWFSPDGEHVFAKGGDRFVKGFSTGSFTAWASFHAVEGSSLIGVAGDLSRVLITRGGKDPAIVNVETKAEKKLERPFGPDTSYEMGPDGRYIAATEKGELARVWDAKTGRVVFELSPSGNTTSQ